MRILVTGATGQAGGALLSRLANLVTVLTPGRANLDLAKPEAIASVLNQLEPELIINPAAYTAVDQAEDDRDLAFTINAESPGAMARWAAARTVPLIHLSTDYVFDGEGTQPWDEDDTRNPLSIYGASKLAGEDAVRSARGPHLIVRTSWLYAATGRNFLCTIARFAAERSELKVVSDQMGAPTSAAVIADALAQMLLADSRQLLAKMAEARGLVHVAAARSTSWHGFATAIVEGLKKREVPVKVERIIPIRTEEYPLKAARPRNSRLALDRLREVFGIVTPSWSDALDWDLDRIAAMLRARSACPSL
jgi:dTDP-4-dehydrorhamnose reductase